MVMMKTFCCLFEKDTKKNSKTWCHPPSRRPCMVFQQGSQYSSDPLKLVERQGNPCSIPLPFGLFSGLSRALAVKEKSIIYVYSKKCKLHYPPVR